MLKRVFLFLLIPAWGYAQDLEAISSQKPFTVSGSLEVRGIGYSARGIEARRSPLMYLVSGSPVFSVYGISIPLQFTYSEQERSFRQPFNQFGMSPAYKWVTLHAGYRNLTFSPYTLAGHTMLGAGAEVNPGKLRLGFMAGRLNRATTIDTTTGVVQPYSFSRHGYAGRIGVGTDDNHFDLSFLSAKDRDEDFKGDLAQSEVRPAANVVLGGDLKLTFAGKFFVFADGGVSVYTGDRNSTVALAADSARIIRTVNRLIPLNGTSEYYVAYSGGLGYKEKNFSLKAAYRYVDPEFRSMGAYYFQNDIKNLTVSPAVNALKGKLRLMASIGIQQDNTQKQKQATTRRVIGLTNLSWDINEKLGLDASYTNFSSNSEPVVALVQNKYLLTQTTANISVNPRIILAGAAHTQMILLSYNNSHLKDMNEETKTGNSINSTVALLNYSITLNRSALTLMTGLNYTVNRLAPGDMTNRGFSLGASRAFLKNKLQVGTQNSYVISTLAQGKSNTMSLGGTAAYQPLPKHRVNFRVNSLKNTYAEGTGTDFSELTAELGYTLSF
ncbi:MAG: hypothetical protein LRY55_01895 [Leadbetterella sp.]|nr:hypothetical protein [Leadbetterella sp.]